MRVVLTGASSFTGFWFARALSESGVEVVAPLRKEASHYEGVRGRRVEALARYTRIVPHIEFGSSEFIDMFDREKCDVLCHHAARVVDYRSLDFDVNLALAENTLGLPALVDRIKNSGCAGIVLTGSVFEADEGAGSKPLRAFSPYGLSKTLTYQFTRFWCEVANVPLGKFVIANPFGPYEEPRFCAYLINTWAKGQTPEVKTPLYVRDNMHVSLLAKAYADFVLRLAKTKQSARYAPTQYVESQGAFAQRFAAEMSTREGIARTVKLGTQTDFSEPMVRINTDPVDVSRLDWNEDTAWTELAAYYAQRDAG